MFRTASSASRVASTLIPQTSSRAFQHARIPLNRRMASTAPSKPSSWRSFFVRLGLAGGVIYYYNTSELFQPQPVSPLTTSEPKPPPPQTLDSLTAAKQRRKKSLYDEKPDPNSAGDVTLASPSSAATTGQPLGSETPASSDPAALEEEAGQQGAFNPETGEINWDCPCLGGMAHGPCGENFRAAFSCFVFSQEEPKGVDCIDKFKGMQDCFREHPDIYGAELEDDDEPIDSSAADAAAKEATKPSKQVEAEKTAAQQQEAVKAKVAEKKDEIVGQAQKTAGHVQEKVQEKASEAASAAAAKTNKVVGGAKDRAAEVKASVAETAQQAEKFAKEKVDVASKKVEEQVKKI